MCLLTYMLPLWEIKRDACAAAVRLWAATVCCYQPTKCFCWLFGQQYSHKRKILYWEFHDRTYFQNSEKHNYFFYCTRRSVGITDNQSVINKSGVRPLKSLLQDCSPKSKENWFSLFEPWNAWDVSLKMTVI